MNAPDDRDNTDDERDSLAPPAIPTLVGCIVCREEYESYLIEHRQERDADGRLGWHWCCATPNCLGRGFGFDIFPIDPEWQDPDGTRGWIQDDDEADDEFDLQLGLDDEDDELPEWDRPPKDQDDDDDVPLPW